MSELYIAVVDWEILEISVLGNLHTTATKHQHNGVIQLKINQSISYDEHF